MDKILFVRRYRWSGIRIHSGDEPNRQPTVIPVDFNAVRGSRHDDSGGVGHDFSLAHGGRHVRRVMHVRFGGAVRSAVHTDVAAISWSGRRGLPG